MCIARIVWNIYTFISAAFVIWNQSEDACSRQTFLLEKLK